jgi:hypothetical protein
MLGLIVFIAVISILVGVKNGASIYRIMFDLGIVGSIGMLFLIPLVFMGGGRATWILPIILLYYLVLMVFSVKYMSNRDKFYEWVIRKLR